MGGYFWVEFWAEARPNNIQEFSSYRKENTTLHHYKDQLVNAVYSENHTKPMNTKCNVNDCQSRFSIKLPRGFKWLIISELILSRNRPESVISESARRTRLTSEENKWWRHHGLVPPVVLLHIGTKHPHTTESTDKWGEWRLTNRLYREVDTDSLNKLPRLFPGRNPFACLKFSSNIFLYSFPITGARGVQRIEFSPSERRV
jgi:hypothetical protein